MEDGKEREERTDLVGRLALDHVGDRLASDVTACVDLSGRAQGGGWKREERTEEA